ncbi:hypothetical protein B0H10DRAFT_1690619, partial [Mycena sp. CBHHK59/15]
SSISTGPGLLCDVYLLLRFSLASVPVCKVRCCPSSYMFFPIIAWLPLMLAFISISFIAVLLRDVVYKLSPLVVWVIIVVTGFGLALRYIFWALIWAV